MKTRFLDAARTELLDAARYYEMQRPGLGAEFVYEASETVKRVEHMPHAWMPLAGDMYRCLMRRFPYSVIYRVRDADIIIIAIAHHHREPDYWRKRS